MQIRQIVSLFSILATSFGESSEESSSGDSGSITSSEASTDASTSSATEVSFASTLDSSQLHLSKQIYFFTNLVSDVSSNAADYFFFSRTAAIDIPKDFGSIADKVRTYTDDSYTTLLADPDFDFNSFAEFVTNLNWYTDRLAVSGVNNYMVSSTSSSSEDHGNVMYAPITFALIAGVIGLL